MTDRRLKEYSNISDVDPERIPELVYDGIADYFLSILIRAAEEGAFSDNRDHKLAV